MPPFSNMKTNNTAGNQGLPFKNEKQLKNWLHRTG